ncbi:DUF6746 family protein, partial [Rhodosalinus sp.]|uniref:DUF6746 family protein n=1 Tax=Rhodosalinus sp. TaxID=2047741 RepID=UPI003567708D
MMTTLKSLIAAVAFGLSATALAADDVQHYNMVESETLDAALTNFVEYNAKVRDV